MSKYSFDQVMASAYPLVMCGQLDVACMLHEYATHLAEQAEWPSEGDVQSALSARLDEGAGAEVRSYIIACDPFHSREDVVRAALQSVRPPVGVVSDEGVIARVLTAAEDMLCPSYRGPDQDRLRAALESYASRHAPTKD